MQEQLSANSWLPDPIYVSLDGVEPTSVLGHRASEDAEPMKVTIKKRNRARGPRKRPGVVPPGKDGKSLAEREAAAKEFCALEKVDADKTLLEAIEDVATLQECFQLYVLKDSTSWRRALRVHYVAMCCKYDSSLTYSTAVQLLKKEVALMPADAKVQEDVASAFLKAFQHRLAKENL